MSTMSPRKENYFMKYIAYVDGSYKSVPGVGEFYSSAAIIAPEGSKQWTQMIKVSSDELISMRNVAGEILAAMMVMEHCLTVLKLTHEDELILNYDYEGIMKWTLPPGSPGAWRAKNETTKAYSNYVRTIVARSFKLTFNHTPGHSGVDGNEIVDKLAREAIEKELLTKRT